MRFSASLYYGGLCAVGLPAINRLVRDAGLILCYHNVVATMGDAHAGGPGLHLPVANFERQIRWLARHYDVVSLVELVDRLSTGKSLRSLAAVTFDDGYCGVFEHAVPVLQALGIPCTIFVVADAADRPSTFWWDHPGIARSITPERRAHWLCGLRGDGAAIRAAIGSVPDGSVPSSHRPASWKDIRSRVVKGIDIGVHSATHRSLTRLTGVELRDEIATTRTRVHDAAGMLPQLFAYPYGLWNQHVRELVRAAGYRGAVTVDYGLNGPSADPWGLRRVNVPTGLSTAAFEVWAAGLSALRTA
jgi:peptidoglycan/xylan/chitin deacetylase (PgdA/CDA1 family)